MGLIRVIDFETTGMEPPAQVCEVGRCDVLGDTGEPWSVLAPASILCSVDAMPPEVRAVHHISLAETKEGLPFSAPILWAEAEAARASVVAAHNADFEGKFWGPPTLPVLCTYKAALRVWPHAPSHSNGALRYWLEDQELIAPAHHLTMPPHRAGPDAYVTAHILTALLKEATARQMVAWTKEPRLLPTCPLGKFRGKPWPEVETGFLSWMLGQPTMEEDLKWNARRELDRRRDQA
jgi:exodeoxyribonuclease X